MTVEQVVRAAIPDADESLAEYVLWARTSFPAGEVTAQSLYKAASGFHRATAHGLRLCDWCHRVAVYKDLCRSCAAALGIEEPHER